MGHNFERKYFRDKIRYLNSVKCVHSMGLSTLKLASLAKMTPDPPYRLKAMLIMVKVIRETF